MKILFAVSNENVSKRIVENYQQKYGEPVSFKNVFYFNAIIREIKNDKTYDRIVISEDLEPFANSNYDVIDKFILERLNEISNETNALEKIPDIVIICTDRRTKSGYVLTKMHEYGIYNALVGADRKIDEVCELLNRPRNSEEAKEYYQIVGSNVDTSSVDDVTEQEVQNILIHYKRLGKNEDRYTDSFNNIASQYTDKQLKIIIKCLPINVRAVLEAECPKYQELVTYAEETEEERKAKEKLQEQRRIEQIENDRKLKQKIEKEKKDAFKMEQKEANRPIQGNNTNSNSGIDLLDNKNAQPRMTGNVIIPNNMNIKNERKIYSDEELQNISATPRNNNDVNQNSYQAQTDTFISSEQENSVITEPIEQFTNQATELESSAPETSSINNNEFNTLPGLDEWDKDPFDDINKELPPSEPYKAPEETNMSYEDPFAIPNTNQQPTQNTLDSFDEITLPGLDNIATQEPVMSGLENMQNQDIGLPGLDDMAMPEEQTLPGLDDMSNQDISLPGLENWDADPFNQNDNQVQNTQNNGTLPGLDDMPNQDISLPGLENWDADPFNQNDNQVQNTQNNGTLPGLSDMSNQDISLPGIDDMAMPEQPVLPGLDDTQMQTQNTFNQFENLNTNEQLVNQVSNNTDMFAELEQSLNTTDTTMNNTEVVQNINVVQPQIQMQDVAVTPEIPQEPKRGRGRPRKYPIEPPKPKGKRGRPRKYPLPEEVSQNQSLQTVQNSMIEVQATLPPQVANQNQMNTANQMVNNNQYNTQTNMQQANNFEQNYGQYNQQQNNTQYVNQTVEQTNQISQNNAQYSQANQTMYNNTQNQYQNSETTQADTLPGLDNWNADPFNQNSNQVQNTQNDNTLPGLDNWNTDPFNQNNNTQVQSAQNDSTLPGLDNWDTDPFNQNSNQVQNAQNDSTLPGLDNWDTDPFNQNSNQVQSAQNDSTLPGLDDWNKDPFAENNDTLPGIDNSIGYSLENTEDTLSSSVVNPYNAYETNNIPKEPVQTNNYNNPQYQNQVNTEYNQNTNNYNQFENIAGPQVGFGMTDNMRNEPVTSYSPSQERQESLQKIEENKSYSTGSLNSVLTRDKKIVAFVGASKSGTSFLVNNLACLFSSIGVKTAILDMTKNKNSYFIYTNNDENLRNIAYTSIENLENGYAQGIPVDRNLNVYTTIPNDGKDYSNAEAILSTLVQNESLILIDCDFDTDLGYLANAQEIYLVQSMDILTIQPLTAFLRDLKTKGILDQEKLRIVINKETKVRGLSSKAIIGGISFYNDPAMSYMTELFNKDKVKACSIPFDENVYSRYLESIVNCAITISGYNKNFINSLKILGNMVYPLLSKQTYGSKSSAEANYGNNFSTEMNNTLNQMKKKY